MTPEIKAASGFDVLCHALESYTAIPFNKRTPRPKTPLLRPAYQGSNPIADVWSLQSLGMLAKYFFRSVEDENDAEARSQMMLAATFAGIGFGSAGVHLCHGMSYPVSSMAHKLNYVPKGYPVDHPMVPHGMSVVLHAPAVFRYTAKADPARHLQVARLMGATTATHNKSEGEEGEAAGELLAERIIYYMQRLKMPRGLTELGVRKEDVPKLVQGTLPQHRVLKLAPLPTASEELTSLFNQSMSIW
ncbi:hydroxyacid-oxoacid transhydrogenase [Balamuthia mandrillaris]